VGYIITIDGITVYASGYTSKNQADGVIRHKEPRLCAVPFDGIFNMGLKEGADCAHLAGAKHNIPIHLNPALCSAAKERTNGMRRIS
jgi:L-ascorbate metabolism protein UlaG (beta-lactamase superfamily)